MRVSHKRVVKLADNDAFVLTAYLMTKIENFFCIDWIRSYRWL